MGAWYVLYNLVDCVGFVRKEPHVISKWQVFMPLYLDSNNKYVEKKYFDKYVEKESDKYVNITFDNWLSYEF